MTVSERMMMEHDDEAARRGAEFQRIYDELFSNNERDWSAWQDYLKPSERDEMMDAIMHELDRDNEPLDGYERHANVCDVRRKYCKRAIERWAEQEMSINDDAERLAKCEREEE